MGMTRQKRPDTYANLAYDVLREKGKPMHHVDITKEVLKTKETKGKTPHQTLRVIIAKDERFEKVDRGIYGLKEW